MPDLLSKKWDDLLHEGLLTPPARFHASVMAQVAQVAQVAEVAQAAQAGQQPEPKRQGHFGLAVQALAVAAAAIAGLIQLASFSLGIWAATAAG